MAKEYDRELSRKYPGLFVILLDQSLSMTEKDVRTNEQKSQIVTRHVNTIIQKMIDIARVDEFTGYRKKYAYLCVLGYNDNVYPLLTPKLTDIPALENNPLARVKTFHEKRNAVGDVIGSVQEKQTIWIEPQADGNTEMTRAFEEAEIVIKSWLNASPEYISDQLGMQRPRKECFPPIVINITDAKHNGDGIPQNVADRIRRLRTENGATLICNCHITHQRARACIFPRDISEVQQSLRDAQNESAQIDARLVERMFEMSSVIPEALRIRAQTVKRQPIEQGARCFVFNADPDILIRFLSWGTLGNLRAEGR
ncbi:MAG: vWA domain-containing protein [Ktedonobacteraceae bacterium]